MPFSPELGMRVYDPREGQQYGLQMGQMMAQAMQSAQRQKLSEREIQLQERQQQRLEDEAARQARYMVRRQRGLQNMAYDYQDLLKVGATPDVAQRMSMIQNLPDIMEGATPQAIEGVLKSDEANQVRLMSQQLLNERLQKTLDLRERLGFAQIQGRKDIVKSQIESAEKRHAEDIRKLTPQQREREDKADLDRQLSDLNTFLKDKPGDTQAQGMRDEVMSRIDAWNQQHGGMETKIEMTPTGTTYTTSKAGKSAKPGPEVLTPTNVNKAQDSLNQSLMTIDAANRLVPLISSETVGPRAFAESWVKDRFLANFFPGLASEKRADAERVAAELRSTTIRELRSDGNISEKERVQILQAVPEINDPIDSPEHARQLIKASSKTAAIRALVTAKRLRVPTPPAVSNTLEDTDLMRMADLGLITPVEANSIRQSRIKP